MQLVHHVIWKSHTSKNLGIFTHLKNPQPEDKGERVGLETANVRAGAGVTQTWVRSGTLAR